MQRRSFLKLLASSSAALAFPSIVRAETLGLNGGVAPSNRLALGYIGVGNQGGGHFRSDLHNPQIQTNAICDVDTGRRQKALERTAIGLRRRHGGRNLQRAASPRVIFAS